ncbi:chromate resistance protein ChrB domain-containing protein [Nitrobacter sp. 62-13]|jgi:rhodanese-related sulfurtransferase|uniref:chromate resistance protein ChrB domain-containing protein n=1 Tax=Nitrobacter sp. 62-13 TaxID=1895797 RepID=UPI000ADB0D88|nr:chromate resistance protein ChrB domain-containing protein [Nitrobacter sp. 62-13]
MDGNRLSISPHDLSAGLGSGTAPFVVDVRSDADFTNSSRLLGPAVHHSPDNVGQWRRDLPGGRQVVTYCLRGDQLSQGVAIALRAMGVGAYFLEGGVEGWTALGFPTRRNIGTHRGKWVTREHPKIDRIACPWLILRFIDPDAEFFYVPRDQVLTVAKQTGATPYDIDGVKFTHEGDRCSFDAIIRVYDIKDPALDRLATIVRGADTSRPDLAPQCEGLLAISRGLSANFPADHEMLGHGLVIYDALYKWCRLEVEKQDLGSEPHAGIHT